MTNTQAIVTLQVWQIKAIEEAVQQADSKNAKWINHDQMIEWLNSWGTEHEKVFPS